VSKILVTGASGFIGKALIKTLEAASFDIVPIDSAEGDIANRDILEKFGQYQIAHVFHLAAKTFVPDSWDDPLDFAQTNILGTLNVLEFCRKNHISMTYVSAYIYGPPDVLPIKEESAVRPNNPYALTKLLAEEACQFYATTYDLPLTIIRPFNVYGIRQSGNFLIPTIIRQALEEPQIIVKDLLPKRDFVYLEDLLSALLATLNVSLKGYNIYNIGSGISLSVKEVIDIIQDVTGTSKKVICEKIVRPNELMDVIADITKAKIELGWYPKYSFRAGIEDIIKLGRAE
jgi:nucleoside-diphosphate-sugar epimerase